MNIRVIFIPLHVVLCFIAVLGQAQNNSTLSKSSTTTSSVLASGNWYKLSVTGDENNTGSGIYKLDYKFLSSIGINLQGVDPTKIRLFGNGGGMLSQKNSDPRPDDLLENAIYISGENDGVFDTTDYILFYAKSPHTWTFDSTAQIFTHTLNLYSDQAFYFLTVGSDADPAGKRVADLPSVSGGIPITIFDEHIFYEPNKINILQSGREWFGPIFSGSTTQSYSFQTPDILSNSSIKITSSVVGRSIKQSSFDLFYNGTKAGTQTFTSFINPNALYGLIGDINNKTFSVNGGTNPAAITKIDLSYNDGGISTAFGHLNFLEINYKRQLTLSGNQLQFRSIDSRQNSSSRFTVTNVSSSFKVWDITDTRSAANQLYQLNAGAASFTTSGSQLREFIAFTGSSFPKPAFVEKIKNQNLHSIDAGSIPDMVIVTAEQFKPAAQRLANFRKQHDNLNVIVAGVNEIYNEFSSGAQDITAIRDFIKMLYDRDNGGDNLKYLLLFGACSYDYKNRINPNTNLVPVYESRQSLNSVDTYSSDDYYGFLDQAEGFWSESPVVNHILDIGVGRIPVKVVSEAEIVVDKLINYSSNPESLGKWRNKILFVADDGDFNGHLLDAENLVQIVDTSYSAFNINKLYINAYPEVATSGGEISPVVKDLINKEIEKGILILNYSGHGSENYLSSEKIIEIPQIASWTNYNKLPFFITATCEFGRYDDPARSSGAELLLISPKGGAVGLLSSTRPVYKNSNIVINSKFYVNSFKSVNGILPRLGDVMRRSKNESLISVANRNYTLLADPSLRLAFPSEELVVTGILNNNLALTTNDTMPDTLRALSKVTVTGEVRNNGFKTPGFKGTAFMTLFDKESLVRTFGTVNSDLSEQSDPINFKLNNNIIFEGTGQIENGNFKIDFVVPKDISYKYGYGKISLYAADSSSLADARGSYGSLVIGSTSKNAPIDNTPPNIKLFMDDTLFVSGGLVKKDTRLIANLTDENGINTGAEGIGHEISMQLDNSKEEVILNNYFSTISADFKKGQVIYFLKNLSMGNHSIRLRAWDPYDNSSEATINFIVPNDNRIGLSHISNYPNPFKGNTTFQFEQSRQGENLDVSIQIYTISGQLIKTLKKGYFSSQTHISDLQWDGKDELGDKINKGIYIYKLKVRSLKDLSETVAYQKLVILN